MPRHRTPARWLAPVALVSAAVAIYAIASDGRSGGGSGKSSTGEGATTTQRQDTTTTRRTAASKRRTYTVKAGDVLSGIAVKTGVPVEELMTLNPDVDAQTLHPGQKLKLR
jgi:LysM repeat protein